MLPELVLFVCTVIALVIWYENQRKKQKGSNWLPGPISLPGIGALLQLGRLTSQYELHYEQLRSICKRYGTVCGVQIGQQYYAVIEDFETAKEVLNSPVWSNRFPEDPIYREHTYNQNLGLMWSSGEAWKEMRRFTSRTLKNFGFGELKAAEALLEEELECFMKTMDEDRVRNGNELYMRQYFKIPTFNILWIIMSGYRFSYDNAEMKKLIHYVEDVAEIQVGTDLEWAFPILRDYIPGFSTSRKKAASFDGCHQFFEDIMRKRRELGTFREVQNDFMDFFLLKVEEEKNNPGTTYTDNQFVATCVDLLFGGVDTTANSLEFAILYMIKNPRVQQKVRDEINAVVGENRTPSNADRSRMPYTEATMLEILRHANIVPVNGRTAACDTVLKGYFVPKNTLAGINTTVIHMNEEIWGDPQAFRPERFLDENMKIINDDKVFAFGAGPRKCLGYTMAKVVWLSFFTRLIQKYSFEPSPAHPELSLYPKGGVANTARPFYCIARVCE